MHNKSIEVYKREFVCRAITIGFFRVSKFRNIFLEQISKGEQLSAEELNNTAFNIDIDELLN